MTGEDGISYSDYFDAALETVYVKEITAPNGYASIRLYIRFMCPLDQV